MNVTEALELYFLTGQHSTMNQNGILMSSSLMSVSCGEYVVIRPYKYTNITVNVFTMKQSHTTVIGHDILLYFVGFIMICEANFQ